MHQFDKDILFEPREPFSFSGYITENWSINGVSNGWLKFNGYFGQSHAATHNEITVIDPGNQPNQSACDDSHVYERSDGYGFVARVQGEKVWLFLPGNTIHKSAPCPINRFRR